MRVKRKTTIFTAVILSLLFTLAGCSQKDISDFVTDIGIEPAENTKTSKSAQHLQKNTSGITIYEEN